MNLKLGAVAIASALICSLDARAQTGAQDDVSNLRAPHNQWISLRLNWRAGDTFRITDRTRDKSVEITPETEEHYSGKVVILTDATQISQYRVLFLHADGAAQVRVSYGDYQKRTVIDGKAQKPSTKNPWRGVQIEMKIAPDGRISNVRGGDKIWRAIVADFDDFTAAQKQEMERYMKQAFGDDSIKHLFEQMGMSYPPNPVRIGQPWFQSAQTKGLMPLSLNLKRTVVSRANGVLNIRENGTLSIGDKVTVSNVDNEKSQTIMSGTFTGDTQIDEASGFTRAALYTTRIGGTTTFYSTGEKPLITRDYSLSTTRLNVQQLR